MNRSQWLENLNGNIPFIKIYLLLKNQTLCVCLYEWLYTNPASCKINKRRDDNRATTALNGRLIMCTMNCYFYVCYGL